MPPPFFSLCVMHFLIWFKSLALKAVIWPSWVYLPARPPIYFIVYSSNVAFFPRCIVFSIVEKTTRYMFRLSPIPTASVATRNLIFPNLLLNMYAWVFLVSGGRAPYITAQWLVSSDKLDLLLKLLLIAFLIWKTVFLLKATIQSPGLKSENSLIV